MNTQQPVTPKPHQKESKIFTGIQRPAMQILKPNELNLRDLLSRLRETK